MKNVLPILFSLPAFMSWAALLYRLFAGKGIPYGPALLGVSFLAFTASIALSFVVPNPKEWRAATLFNAIPFILIVLAALITGV